MTLFREMCSLQAPDFVLLLLFALGVAGCTCEAECFPYCSDDAGVTDAR
jgi:hypothetical protein